MATVASEKESRFMAIVNDNRRMLCKVCYMYADSDEHFKDLYQEVLANLWQGLDSFRGDSRLSTWLYRTAINTCVTYFRHNGKHDRGKVGLDTLADTMSDDSDRPAELRQMYRLIGGLDKMDKALILMWLDEKSYDEIAGVTGLPRNTVATRLHRIKLRLKEQNEKES
ncbi:MAG: sigma-70 family RNA polymerase sigma factor [Duncaniella sp.]|jgi:RNA polymerase sigma-70 factor (ECF subfamily)|uniref:RNA polymerase sigma factor n=1 Tax=Duncaniella muricolitica TaxID=2880704 RepID=UPI00244E42D9|nr:sigma-70 family RNA polymerase sigma factor [Duncaniella muricolitica]MCX4368241.1 sigma-70 family RNA polymerase sigma factor [Duncaniella sp.]